MTTFVKVDWSRLKRPMAYPYGKVSRRHEIRVTEILSFAGDFAWMAGAESNKVCKLQFSF